VPLILAVSVPTFFGGEDELSFRDAGVTLSGDPEDGDAEFCIDDEKANIKKQINSPMANFIVFPTI
jgi:hypothetical protein